MALLTLLPMGMMQLLAALEHGYWYARSAEFMQQPIIQLLVWMRVPGDTIFSVGALALAWFVLRLWIAPIRSPRRQWRVRDCDSTRQLMTTVRTHRIRRSTRTGVALAVMLAAAPHRLLFFVGAANVLLAMTWWALWLVDARWHLLGMPQPPIHAAGCTRS